MTVIRKGTVMSQPRLSKGEVVFTLDSGGKAITVARRNPEDQKRDILFLCAGQQILLWGRPAEGCVIAEKIRILDCGTRSYVTKEIGGKDHGDQAICRDDTSDPPI